MKKFLVALSLVSLVSFLLGFDKEDIKDYPNSDLVVTADWVEEREGKGNIYIIDVREKGYEQEHIPLLSIFQ
ncbi:hypothetical protein JCM9140_4234 [Halalkalibacter wakoensis JCM 9140]|uniref:Rhodanese domain-containing protein n=1 Tax=Halalkalibacter wakoensis JCM 9140 TaxID=1236970 RepID=W4Q7J3_9BACI|nr:hypothetical protein [Halalkalibacter wakoensis]GAE28046.1 hypothetical protein JCM9140_4234 [Halalkalibacter wakoensis JCM 9140]